MHDFILLYATAKGRFTILKTNLMKCNCTHLFVTDADAIVDGNKIFVFSDKFLLLKIQTVALFILFKH